MQKDIHHHSPKQTPNICHLCDPSHFSLRFHHDFNLDRWIQRFISYVLGEPPLHNWQPAKGHQSSDEI
jgi:hypothetical protein